MHEIDWSRCSDAKTPVLDVRSSARVSSTSATSYSLGDAYWFPPLLFGLGDRTTETRHDTGGGTLTARMLACKYAFEMQTSSAMSRLVVYALRCLRRVYIIARNRLVAMQ